MSRIICATAGVIASQAAAAWSPVWQSFNGSTTTLYKSDVAPKALASSAKRLMFFALRDYVNNGGYLWNQSNSSIFNNGPNLSVGFRDTLGNTICSSNTSLTFPTAGADVLCHLLVYVDNNTTAPIMKAAIYKAGSWTVADLANIAATDNALHFDSDPFYVGRYWGGGYGTFELARIAVWQEINVDITDSAVRDLFINSGTGAVIDPATSVASLGTPRVDCYTTWDGTNHGSGPTLSWTA